MQRSFQMRPNDPGPHFENDSDVDSEDSWIQDARLALELQGYDDQQLGAELAGLVRPFQQFNVDDPEDEAQASPTQEPPDEFDSDDWQQLRQLQDLLDANRRLRQAQEEPTEPMPHCSICLDELPEDEIAEVYGCTHIVCRSCLNQLIPGIQKHQPPVLCPVCIKKADTKPELSVFSRILIGQFGIGAGQSQSLVKSPVQVHHKLQDEFDAQDQQQGPSHYPKVTFDCGICMDELSEEDVARIDGCMHMMCRTCLRRFVSSKIQEHRYPILCPVCTTEKTEPSAISRELIEQIGISEEQFRTLTEMELTEFTVQIYCRECQRPAWLDREDFAEMLHIVCPQDDCFHIWCKKCDQSIVADGPDHSCDGTAELEHLMEEMGWKHCPHCTTPILKDTGCNHMTCISAGCNTHFCYLCGDMIVRSAIKHEIDAALSAHYQGCQMIDDIED